MQNIVLDTNIIISAVLTPTGNPAKIVNMALDKSIQLNLSAKILKRLVNSFSGQRYEKMKDEVIEIDYSDHLWAGSKEIST